MSARVYVASKLKYADELLAMRKRFLNIHFTDRWSLMQGKVEDDHEQAAHFWQDDFDDIARAEYVIIWAPSSEDKLRGALVEAGIGIALGKKLVLAGESPDFGTWQWHPAIISRQPDLRNALECVVYHKQRAG